MLSKVLEATAGPIFPSPLKSPGATATIPSVPDSKGIGAPNRPSPLPRAVPQSPIKSSLPSWFTSTRYTDVLKVLFTDAPSRWEFTGESKVPSPRPRRTLISGDALGFGGNTALSRPAFRVTTISDFPSPFTSPTAIAPCCTAIEYTLGACR